MIEIWNSISTWYNLPFTLLIAMGLMLSALQLIGLGGDQESESDLDHEVDLQHDLDLDHDLAVDHDLDLDHDLAVEHDLDLDHELDLSHDIDADHDLDMGHDLEHEVDHDLEQDLSHDVDAGASFLNLMAFLGVGKVPLMVVLLIFFYSIGMLGWLLNGLVNSIFNMYPGLVFAGVLPLAVVVGSLITSRTTRFMGLILPPISTTATRAQGLVGRRGKVTSPFVDSKYGLVHLRDSGGTLISIFVVSQDEDPIQRGEEVLLLSYQVEQKRYLVTRANPNLPSAHQP